jgi:hypothetical protein
MNSKLIFSIIFGVGVIVGWNAFLIQRDQELYDAYYGKETPKEHYCKQQAHWHPDCNVE